jgi:hypothetical protein
MATSYTSKKLSFNNAEQFKESFAEPQPTVGYLFIGNNVPYANELSPNSIVDSTSDEKTVWDNMFAAKKVTGNDVELVVPRINWTSTRRYKQFDDKISTDELLTADSGAGGNSQPMYVLTSARNVYKCLSNNANVVSTVEPSGDYNTANGTIRTADGYIWKYLYNVKASNKFLTSAWIPAPISTSKLDYNVSSTSVIDGELVTIMVTNGGTGYANPTTTAAAFGIGVITLTLTSAVNVAANMTVTGTGIATGTLVSTVNTLSSIITISSATTANGGGTGNNITFGTRVYISGDGSGAEATANIVNSSISKITVDVTGLKYSFANAIIYGSGTGANVRVVLPPKYGHGMNPAKELDGSNVMVAERIGQVDASESGLISTSTSIRQYGLLRDPYKYGANTAVSTSNANTVISQTVNLTLVAGSAFSLDEFVYQGGAANNAYFYGFVNSQTSNEVRLTKVRGDVAVGGLLIGATSGVTRTVVKRNNPEFQPYTGDIEYVENVTKIQRADGQAENIKFVIRF